MTAYELRGLTTRLWATSPVEVILEDGTILRVTAAELIGPRPPAETQPPSAEPDRPLLSPPKLRLTVRATGKPTSATCPPAPPRPGVTLPRTEERPASNRRPPAIDEIDGIDNLETLVPVIGGQGTEFLL